MRPPTPAAVPAARLLLALAPSLLAGCPGDAPPAGPPPGLRTEDVTSEVTHVGVTLTFGEDVRFVSRTSVPEEDGDGMFVNGQRVLLEGGELRIGERSYGPVEAGQHAHVTAAGVEVDGVRRGPLP